MTASVVPGLVSTVILNWNGLADTVECIRSCQQLAYPHNTLLVIDNGSTDGSVAGLRELFPDLKIIETEANLGYAGGNNVGIETALADGAEFIWLLNNDTTFDPAALGELVAALKAGLQLTPDQAKNWPAFEQALRDMAQLRMERRQAREAAEQQRQPVGGNADAGVGHGDGQGLAGPARGHADLAAVGEFQRV